MIEILGELKGELEIKRMYLEGVTINCTCPKCDNKFIYDQYLSYPDINKTMEMEFYCSECNYDWLEKITLSMKIISQKR